MLCIKRLLFMNCDTCIKYNGHCNGFDCKKLDKCDTSIKLYNGHCNGFDSEKLQNSDTSINLHNEQSNGFDSKELRVACLQSVDTLKEICKEQGLKFNDCAIKYEVDMIFDHKVIDDEVCYYVKWKNYSCEFNTWEPLCNLTGCREAIKYYYAVSGTKLKVNEHILSFFVRDLTSRRPYDLLTMTKVCALCFGTSEKYVDSLKLSLSQMKAKIREILSLPPKRLQKLKYELFRIMQYGESRKRTLIDLQEWEDKINASMPSKNTHIKVENNVDLVTAPTDFDFVYDYVSSVVTPREEALVFCTCTDCCKEKNSCCPNDSDGLFAYNRYKRLILEPGYPIFECSKKCHCSMDCPNRVVQHGQKVKVSIFRTANGTGWGLKTLETIEKGQFVLEYLGEIITSETAEARGRIYDYVGRSYLFDLDYGVDNAAYTIDARHLGNAARFINHSCTPNLHVFAVWINEEDPNLPRLAFFAKRRILRGEELTFDYKMQKDYNGPKGSSSKNERVLCRCKSKNCRKFLF